MKMKESVFGAPAGIYLGQFQGLMPMKTTDANGKPLAPRVGKDGKPMPAGVEWQFKITEDGDNAGKYVGQFVGRITGPDPTTKNSCGELLSGLVGMTKAELTVTERDINPGDFVGFTYRIVVGPSKDDPNKTQVVQIVRVKNANGTPPPPTSTIPGYENRPSPQAPPAPPPPRPTAPSPPPPSAPPAPRPPLNAGPLNPTPPDEPLYWVHDGKKMEQLTATAVRDAHKSNPEFVDGWQYLDEKGAWQPVRGSFLADPF